MSTTFDARTFAPTLRAELPCPVLFAGVSGAHLYGFPSPDSDVDLRACHILPVADFLRLDEPRLTLDHTWRVEGVEVDLVSQDLKKFVPLLLRQNGNYLEQLFAPLVVIDSDWAEELRAIMRSGGIARYAYHAYANYAHGKWQEWRADARSWPPPREPAACRLYLMRRLSRRLWWICTCGRWRMGGFREWRLH